MKESKRGEGEGGKRRKGEEKEWGEEQVIKEACKEGRIEGRGVRGRM